MDAILEFGGGFLFALPVLGFACMGVLLGLAPRKYRAWEDLAKEDEGPTGQGWSHWWLYALIGLSFLGAFGVAHLAAMEFADMIDPEGWGGKAVTELVRVSLYFGVPSALFGAAGIRG